MLGYVCGWSGLLFVVADVVERHIFHEEDHDGEKYRMCHFLYIFVVVEVGVRRKNRPRGRYTLPAPRNAREFSNFSPRGGGGCAVCCRGCFALQSGLFHRLRWASLAYASGCLVVVKERLLAKADGRRSKSA